MLSSLLKGDKIPTYGPKSTERRWEHEVLRLHSAHNGNCLPGTALRLYPPNTDCTPSLRSCNHLRLLHYLEVPEGERQGGQPSNGTLVQEGRDTQDLLHDGRTMGMRHHVQMATFPRGSSNRCSTCVLDSADEQPHSPGKAEEAEGCVLVS